mmetsp:Transcript_8319/g.22926  ORF Transcript_8319/g.22926 Transcript_8319/m.22926 type:complete len:215 (-) Transcript_8319:268-912(-)
MLVVPESVRWILLALPSLVLRHGKAPATQFVIRALIALLQSEHRACHRQLMSELNMEDVLSEIIASHALLVLFNTCAQINVHCIPIFTHEFIGASEWSFQMSTPQYTSKGGQHPWFPSPYTVECRGAGIAELAQIVDDRSQRPFAGKIHDEFESNTRLPLRLRDGCCLLLPKSSFLNAQRPPQLRTLDARLLDVFYPHFRSQQGLINKYSHRAF